MGRKVKRTIDTQETIVFGLTGIFCSGKTTVLHIFKKCGAKIFDCDKVAHRALYKNSPVYKRIVSFFGKKILTRTGAINRSELARIVFNNKAKRKKLESYIHPYVLSRLEIFIKKNKGVLVAEVPLLFEAKLAYMFDYTIVAASAKKTCIARAQKKFPHWAHGEIEQRFATQLSLSEKKRRADFIVDTTTVKRAVSHVLHIWNAVQKTI